MAAMFRAGLAGGCWGLSGHARVNMTGQKPVQPVGEGLPAGVGESGLITERGVCAASLACLRRGLPAFHYMVAAGRDLDQALHVALEVEALCGQFWRASLLGEPVLLSDGEMDAVLERFKSYGPGRGGR